MLRPSRQTATRNDGNLLPYGNDEIHQSGTAGVAAKQSNFSLNRSRRKGGQASFDSNLLTWAIGIISVIIVIVFKVKYNGLYSRYEEMERSQRSADIARSRAEKDLDRMNDRYEGKMKELDRKNSLINSYTDRIRELEKSRASLIQAKKDMSLKLEGADDEKVVRDDAIRANIEKLQKKIQKESHREVMEKFGPGPHQVQFEVELTPNNSSFFTVEAAPLSLMPHSVHLFLEQVHHKLWDGCTFIVNPGHLMQAGPYTVLGNLNETLKNAFVNTELETVAFQEYSHDFPHVQYTLGYTARSGGPDFYINKVDNVEDHGPGGQLHYVLQEEADPCFAKIVDGFDVLEKMSDRTVVSKYSVLKQPVPIKSVQVIGDWYIKQERKIYEEYKKKFEGGQVPAMNTTTAQQTAAAQQGATSATQQAATTAQQTAAGQQAATAAPQTAAGQQAAAAKQQTTTTGQQAAATARKTTATGQQAAAGDPQKATTGQQAAAAAAKQQTATTDQQSAATSQQSVNTAAQQAAAAAPQKATTSQQSPASAQQQVPIQKAVTGASISASEAVLNEALNQKKTIPVTK